MSVFSRQQSGQNPARKLDSRPGGIIAQHRVHQSIPCDIFPYVFVWWQLWLWSGAMAVTKPYKFIGFGVMAVTKPYKFIGFGAWLKVIDFGKISLGACLM